MAIIYSYPTVIPTTDDLVLGTDVNKSGNPTKNFTIGSIIDLVTAGAGGLGATIKLSNSAKDPVTPFNNQSAIDFLNISGTGNVTGFNSFSTADGASISGKIGSGFTSITSVDFAGNLTGIVKAGSSIAGLAGGTDAQNVLGVTQNVGDNSTRLATTAYVMAKVDPSVLTFLGTTGGNQTVNLAAQELSLLGTTSEIKTVSSAQTLTISLADGAFGSGTELILPDGASATTQAATDNTTKVATTAFVNTEDDAQDLDFTADDSTTLSIDLDSESLQFSGGTGIGDFDQVLKNLDTQGAIEENMLFLNRSLDLDFDDMLGQISAGQAGGTAYGLFENSEDMALNLGFSGFRRGSYDFYKTSWKYLNDASTRGGVAVSGIEGVLIPAGTSTVYDQQLGTNIRRPFLHVRYRASQTEDRRYKNWITGSAGGAYTSALDAMQVNWLSERCLVTQAANNFVLFQ